MARMSICVMLLGAALLSGGALSQEAQEHCNDGDCKNIPEDEVVSSNLLMKTQRVTMLQEALREEATTANKVKSRRSLPPMAPAAKQTFNGVCPHSHPWAYRPASNLDYCCRTPDDNSGNVGINGLADRSLRASSCKSNGYARCPSPPCNDNEWGAAGGKVYSSNCPESHPYAYRPGAGLDYCCKTADDNNGNVGINGLADKDARSSSCKSNQYFRCPTKPCADFGEDLGTPPTDATVEWRFLDHFPGTFVKCAGVGRIECASDDGASCLWGNFGGAFSPFESVKSLMANTTHHVACPGWLTTDGSDPCESLGCYANGTSSAPAPAPPAATGKCAPLVLPGYQVGACSDLAPGQSCEVSCPADLKGFPVRYTCFSALAAAGKPPVALRLPQCYTPTNFLFAQAGWTKLHWLEHEGCLKCSSWRQCTLEVGTSNGDSTCTSFAISKADDETFYRFKTQHGQCLSLSSWIDIPKIGLWGCSGANTQKWLVEPSPERPGGWHFCASDYWRGKVCVEPQGLPSKYAHVKPDATTVAPAITAMAAGDNATFLQQAMAMQVCSARMDATGVPDTFWEWLKTQDISLVQALFASFPVSPGQLKMFHEIREAVGHAEFERLEMKSFAVALAYINRNKQDLDEHVQVPHPIYERNNNGFTSDERDEVKEEYEDGVRFHNPSCNGWESWNFSWPRDPSPSIRQWLAYWQQSIVERGDGLWENPLQAVPWHLAVYLWPSPLEECEWVRRVLLDGETLVGRWYLYTFDYYDNICAGEGPYGDSLMGIAEYGGVCDRMAELEWRKSGCMGMPAQQKSEPGHWAGLKFASKTGRFTKLNAITDFTNTYTVQLIPEEVVTMDWVVGSTAFPNTTQQCLSCPSSYSSCSLVDLDSGACTQFSVDTGAKRIRAVGRGQCMDMFWGPKPGLWSCGGGTNVNQDFTENAEGELVISSNRGSIRLRRKMVPDTVGPQCLKCTSSWSTCDRAPLNSTDCTHFQHDEAAQLFRVNGQCVDMFSGPQPGLWSCSATSHNQRLLPQSDGTIQISASRGTLTFQRFPVAADTSEYGRCLVCSSGWRDCTFEAADSEACTEFMYDETTLQLRLQKWNQCLYTKGPQAAALWGCDSASNVGEAQRAVVQGDKFIMTKNGGKMQLVVPGQTPLPSTLTRWAADFYHVVDCQKGNCHYPSALTLNSGEMFDWRHGEAAIAAVDAYNDYAKKGLWPTAHDEARLAASFAYFFHANGQVPDQDLEPVLSWALKRNPALYDAWELAASFPMAGFLNASGMPQRADQKSRQWYDRLGSLLSIYTATSRAQTSAEAQARAQARADSFAREHLTGEEAQRRWAKRPQLLQSLVGSLCGALSEPLLAELGEASAQCRLVRQLAKGEVWDAAADEALEADVGGTGNLPSEAFMLRWEAMTRLAMVDGHEGQSAKLAEAVKYLLAHLTVGYINERSQTFFMDHSRVILRGPYAHTLQLAAMVLPEADRQLLLNTTKALLERPWEQPDKLLASPAALKNTFLEWVSYHHPNRGSSESAAVGDSVDGYLATDAASPEVMKQMQLDRDEQVEQGAGSDHPTTTDKGADAAERYDVVKLLERLLGLQVPEVNETSSELELEAAPSKPIQEHSVLAQQQARRLAVHDDQNSVLRMCVDDMFGA